MPICLSASAPPGHGELPAHDGPAGLRDERLRWLRERVAAIGAVGERRAGRRLSLGSADLDAALGGGLEAGALHEIFPADAAAHAATLWFAAMLAAQMPGPVLWCTGFRDMFAPTLAAAGLGPERIIHARTAGLDALLSSMEEGLGAVGCIVGEAGRDVPMAATRRLQLGSAREAALVLLLYRPPGRADFVPTAAASRWRLGVLPSAASAARAISGSAGLGVRRLRLDLLRLRGGGMAGPQSWTVEVRNGEMRSGEMRNGEMRNGEMRNGTAGFAVVADLADRSVAAGWRREEPRGLRLSG